MTYLLLLLWWHQKLLATVVLDELKDVYCSEMFDGRYFPRIYVLGHYSLAGPIPDLRHPGHVSVWPRRQVITHFDCKKIEAFLWGVEYLGEFTTFYGYILSGFDHVRVGGGC